MSGLELVFETHALTTDNERGIATGWNGGALSERGRALAAELGERRRDDGIDLVVASDLDRSMETARIAFATGGPSVRLDWRLREIDYGALTGAHPATLDRAAHIDTPFPRGESYRQVVMRVGRFLDDLTETRESGRVLLIGHTATRWALDHLLDGVALDRLVVAPFAWREGWEYVIHERRLDGLPV